MIAIERIKAALSVLKPELKKPWAILDRLPYIHATDDRHRQELLAMEITLQNMAERHAQELTAYELTVANLRAELAKPVERVEPITLDQFRAIAHRTATTYRHRSDPEKSSYAFVDGSSLDDFWRKVCEAIQPTSAWHDAPTCAGLWLCNYGILEVVCINQPDVDNFDDFYNAGGRWYGPIPQDKEGGAA